MDFRLIAHRGSSARYPEHTRAAFQEALNEGADGIECDVRLTADGAVVCWHDDTVDRTTSSTGAVADWPLAELAGLDLLQGRSVPASHGDPARQLMTLSGLLDLSLAAGRPLLLAIELKAVASPDHGLLDAVLGILSAAGWNPESGQLGRIQISLQCFDVPTVAALMTAVPLARVMLLTEPEEDHEPDALALLDTGTAQAGPWLQWVKRDPDRVRQWLDRGSVVRVWTVDTVEDLEFCLDVGVREITTNRPGELREALLRRPVAASTDGLAPV
ncbi:glycerophosphodiester phosphodiesterase [Naasia aerilata]|uniref:Glycerophosphoryl diester phosphodiesterase n=1 Tax=Naasia aerilata TaxID=1162966 RepID=A0ABM8GDV6_9MICO|nr:glycerophosphodiester phosphodiesterase family protein [Naasia aerilata]BDZ46469.1 putative glycerophosphoryl diester phosphodiesterase [Naasia aerilata]